MSVKVRKKGADFYLFIDHKGKRKAKKVSRSRSEANALAAKVEAKLAAGDLSILAEEPKSFKHYAEIWEKNFAYVGRAKSTADEQIRTLKNHIKPWSLYTVPIDRLPADSFQF